MNKISKTSIVSILLLVNLKLLICSQFLIQLKLWC